MGILDCLNSFSFIKRYEVLKFKYFEEGFYIKIKVDLKNNTQLYLTEYSDNIAREYSYHWQTIDGKLIIRWDNAPHHKNTRTYPHHKHVGENVYESFELDCYSILKKNRKIPEELKVEESNIHF